MATTTTGKPTHFSKTMFALKNQAQDKKKRAGSSFTVRWTGSCGVPRSLLVESSHACMFGFKNREKETKEM